MVCSREKGLVYAFEGDGTPVAFDPGVGSASRVVVLAEPVVMVGVFDDRRYSIPQTHRFIAQSLVMDPKNANVLYGAVNAYGSLGTARAPFLIMKLTVKGKELVGIAAHPTQGGCLVRVSDDGQRVAAIAGDRCPGGDIGITLIDAKSMSGVRKSASGVADCGDYPRDLALHPVLDLGAAEQDQPTQTVLHLFNCKSLNETKFTLARTFARNGNIKQASNQAAMLSPSGQPLYYDRLLTFGARGTKLIYYDWKTGYLRSFPLTLTDKDKEALAKAYPGEGK